MQEELTGEILRPMLRAGMLWIGRHRDHLNQQNVYPVPDGDTGTNLWLTLRSAWQAIDRSGSPAHAGSLWRAAAQGALEGSRGNSGVILSQFMQGVGQVLGDSPVLSLPLLRRALDTGHTWAYKAVASPQEGTILTVARDMAAAAQSAAAADSFEIWLQDLVQVAHASVQRTPELLPVLQQAGVVDAGGLGLALFMEGLLKGYRQEPIDWAEEEAGPVSEDRVFPHFTEIPDRVHGFDVQFLVHQPCLPVRDMRTRVAAMGEHALVEGDAGLVKVHVHVMDPGPVLSWALTAGFITDVVVENMDAMAAAMARRSEPQPVEPEGQVRLLMAAPADEVAVVAVSSSPGFAALFESLGVHCLIECAETINPSVHQFRKAMELAGGSHTVILANSVNALAAARQASDSLPAGRVAVIETPSVPSGIAAMYGFERTIAWPAVVQHMTVQAERIVYGSIACATRDMETAEGTVRAGDFVAMAQGREVLSGHPSPQAAARALFADYLLRKAGAHRQEDYTVVTVYQGAEAADAMAAGITEVLAGMVPEYDVEWVDARQPHHMYMFVLE